MSNTSFTKLFCVRYWLCVLNFFFNLLINVSYIASIILIHMLQVVSTCTKFREYCGLFSWNSGSTCYNFINEYFKFNTCGMKLRIYSSWANFELRRAVHWSKMKIKVYTHWNSKPLEKFIGRLKDVSIHYYSSEVFEQWKLWHVSTRNYFMESKR